MVTSCAKHPMVAWLAQWAAMTINIAREGPDGRTAWENDALVMRSVATRIWRESALHAHGRNVTADWLRGFSFVYLGTDWARALF